MNKKLRVLIVEDSEDDARLLIRELEKGGYELEHERVETSDSMQAALDKDGWDIILADYVLPHFSGLDALILLQKSGKDLPFILVSGKIGEDIAVDAMKAGAHDYIKKENLSRLIPAIEREIRQAVVRQERRKAQEELKNALNVLARSNAEMEQFVHLVSRDLQRPLDILCRDLTSINRHCTEKSDAEELALVTNALEAVTRMQKRNYDILAYSRVGTHFEDNDCNTVLEKVLSHLKNEINKHSAEITSDPLPVVKVDSKQVFQLFDNLLENAIKFRSDEALKIHISAEKKDAEWLFSVKDNGIGIDPEYHDHIFLISQKIYGEDKESTGMGLAICKKIVERHGGRIWVESKPTIGSTFYFTIPMDE